MAGPRPATGANARDVLERAIASRVFPCAVAEVGSRAGVVWRRSFGTLTFDPEAAAVTDDTVFDLASLTKPLATLSVLLDLADAEQLRLDDPVAVHLESWHGLDRAPVTLADLLEHASGLPARLLDRAPDSRAEFLADICATPLEYQPRTRSVYSDLGFILLGLIAEARGGQSLGVQFATLRERLCPLASMEMPMADAARRARAAPTRPLPEDIRRGRLLRGEVHDNYAALLGGAAGHAGLFGTAEAVGRFARALLDAAVGSTSLPAMPAPETPSLLRLVTTRGSVPASSRGLAWDTMLPGSSCGAHMSTSAFGHVGFTGTSLWIDPPADRYYVLLTNRACDGGTLEQMRTVRRAFHDVWTVP